MKKLIRIGLLLICAVQVHSYSYNYRQRNTSPRPRTTWHYISNWKKYNLPVPVHNEDLQTILVQIARFKRGAYCPLNDERKCGDPLFLDEIIKRIVKQSVQHTYEEEKAAKNPCVTYTPPTIRRPMVALRKRIEEPKRPIWVVYIA